MPRGGGTGYTGGAVPLTWKSAVINTEKLEAMTEVECVACPASSAGGDGLDRGRRGHAARGRRGRARRLRVRGRPDLGRGRCIGGNIAMNAGGKKAVLWGTALDNLASWRMVTPDAQWLEVVRLNHNLGKIHDAEMASFKLHWLAADGKTLLRTERLDIPGPAFRKEGLGKDVTDKFLAGLPASRRKAATG
jgi:FAD/FMN-containing dehydrogenase